MNIYDYQGAFGAADITGAAMQAAIQSWFALYYRSTGDKHRDPCQRVAYTVVNKLSKAVFGEYKVKTPDKLLRQWLKDLNAQKRAAVQQALIGGECYLKPCLSQTGFSFTLIPRNNILIFGRNAGGTPVDVGTAEQYRQGKFCFTLLERRTLDERGYLTIENRLYRSQDPSQLGREVSLSLHPQGDRLADRFTYPRPLWSTGLVRLRAPGVNCVDGSPDGVAVFAPAMGLIRAIDENEAQMAGEFRRGQSRLLVSADLLDEGLLQEDVFVALDEDPQSVGMTVFSPQLREQSYLARKQEYLRNVETLTGLKRGMLSDASLEQRTATEIAASNAEFNLSVMDLQKMWELAVEECMELCRWLAHSYGLPVPREWTYSISWGNGVLFDEAAAWQEHLGMVKEGLLRPELALGWRFGMATDTEEDLAAVRKKLMP